MKPNLFCNATYFDRLNINRTYFDVDLIWNKCSDVIIAVTKDSKKINKAISVGGQKLGSRSSCVVCAFVADGAQEASPKHYPGKNLVHKNQSKDGDREEETEMKKLFKVLAAAALLTIGAAAIATIASAEGGKIFVIGSKADDPLWLIRMEICVA